MCDNAYVMCWCHLTPVSHISHNGTLFVALLLPSSVVMYTTTMYRVLGTRSGMRHLIWGGCVQLGITFSTLLELLMNRWGVVVWLQSSTYCCQEMLAVVESTISAVSPLTSGASVRCRMRVARSIACTFSIYRYTTHRCMYTDTHIITCIYIHICTHSQSPPHSLTHTVTHTHTHTHLPCRFTVTSLLLFSPEWVSYKHKYRIPLNSCCTGPSCNTSSTFVLSVRACPSKLLPRKYIVLKSYVPFIILHSGSTFVELCLQWSCSISPGHRTSFSGTMSSVSTSWAVEDRQNVVVHVKCFHVGWRLGWAEHSNLSQ